MKILLTGAGGSVGKEVLKQLIDSKKHDITVLELQTKRTRERLRPYRKKVTLVYGSITDRELVESLIKGKEAVIHLAAVIPPLADREPDLTRNVNFFGSQIIVNAIMKEKKQPFLLYSSSVSIYGDRLEDYWIKVGDELCPSDGDYYAATKIAVEEMIQESGIPFTIFRLTGIMGHPKTDPLMFHMPLDTKLEIASTIDTSRAFVNALDHLSKLNGSIYNLGGGIHCRTTYRDFLTHMFKIYGLNMHYLKEIAFAEKNFHCGYFLDSNILENILHFQSDTLGTYYNRVDKETRRITRFFSRILSRPIIYFLQKKSEPLEAIKKNKTNLLDRFFKKK